MKTPIGGNKWSHGITAKIRQRLAIARRQRRAPDGRFEDAISQVRRDAVQAENIQALIAMPLSDGPDVSVEGCAIEV